ncbi:MAG: hypothetical protein ABJD97_08020 [Betaproteobacteria bacterium]
MDKPSPKARPGRPAFKATIQQRNAVAIAAGAGMAHEAIALALGINRETLNRHFKLELSTGASAKRLEVMRALYAAAKKGNVAAAKAYLLMGATPAVPREPAPGKKVLAQRAAVVAAVGTSWEDLLDVPVDPAKKTPLQ